MVHYKYEIEVTIDGNKATELITVNSAQEAIDTLRARYPTKKPISIAAFYKHINKGYGPYFTVKSIAQEKKSKIILDREYRQRRKQKIIDQANRIKELEVQLKVSVHE